MPLAKPIPVAQLSRLPAGKVALVWRGDANAAPTPPSATRFHLIFSALNDIGLDGEPVLYSEEAEAAIRARLLAVDGVLVWVDPLSAGKDRARLDALLREVAARGVWVSAHPDVNLKIGVKDVLYRTPELGWGADTDLYLKALIAPPASGVEVSSDVRTLARPHGRGARQRQ